MAIRPVGIQNLKSAKNPTEFVFGEQTLSKEIWTNQDGNIIFLRVDIYIYKFIFSFYVLKALQRFFQFKFTIQHIITAVMEQYVE